MAIEFFLASLSKREAKEGCSVFQRSKSEKLNRAMKRKMHKIIGLFFESFKK